MPETDTMQALVLHAPNDFSIEKVDVPRPGHYDVLCRARLGGR